MISIKKNIIYLLRCKIRKGRSHINSRRKVFSSIIGFDVTRLSLPRYVTTTSSLYILNFVPDGTARMIREGGGGGGKVELTRIGENVS